MKIFLTGATGFLGSVIAQKLASCGHQVAALMRSDSPRLSGVSLLRVQGDLFEPESYRGAMSSFAPDTLLHCGWRGVAGADRNEDYQLSNVTAATALYSSAIDCGVRKIVGVGSQAEYGPKAGRIDETQKAEPTTLYGVAKLAAAQTLFVIAARAGVEASWGRVFSLYGPGDAGDWLIPMLIRTLREGCAPRITRCEQIWEYTHVDDAANAFVALIETPQTRGVFNVGSGAATPLRDIVLLLRDAIAPAIEPQFGAIAYRADQVMHLEANIDRICAATNWAPKIGLREGLMQMLVAAQKDEAA